MGRTPLNQEEEQQLVELHQMLHIHLDSKQQNPSSYELSIYVSSCAMTNEHGRISLKYDCNYYWYY